MKIKRKLLRIIQIFILSLMLLYFVNLNSTFTDSFYTVGIREIDDQAFLVSTYERFRQLKLFNFANFIGNNDYGYGVFYWIASFLSALPGFLLNSTKLIIFGPRFLSAASCVIGSFLISRTIENNVPKKFRFLSLIGLLGLFLPSILYVSLRIHNRGLIFLLTSLSIYFLLNPKLNFIRRARIAFIFQSLAIGTSAYALCTLPLFIITFLDLRKIQIKKQKFKIHPNFLRNTLFTGILTFFLAYQPKFLLFPIYLKDCLNSIKSTLGAILMSKNIINSSQYNSLSNFKSTLLHYFHIEFFLVFALASIILFFYKNRINQYYTRLEPNINKFFIGVNNSTKWSLLWFLFYALVLSLFVRQPSVGLANYLTPLTPYLLISIVDIMILLAVFLSNKRFKTIYAFGLFLLFIYAFPINSSLYKQYSNQYQSDFKLSRLREYNSYKNCLKEIFEANTSSKKLLHVAADYDIVIPCSSIDKSCYHQSIFGEYPKITKAFDPDIIIFNDSNKFKNYINNNNLFIKEEGNSDSNFDSYYIIECGKLNILSKNYVLGIQNYL